MNRFLVSRSFTCFCLKGTLLFDTICTIAPFGSRVIGVSHGETSSIGTENWESSPKWWCFGRTLNEHCRWLVTKCTIYIDTCISHAWLKSLWISKLSCFCVDPLVSRMSETESMFRIDTYCSEHSISQQREREIERCRYRSQQNCYRTNGTPLASNVKQFIRGFKEYPIGIYREPLYYAILMAQTFFNTTINKGHVVAETNTIILIQIPAVKAVNQTWPRKINYPPSLDNVPS